EGRLPPHLSILDHVHSDGPGGDPEPATRPRVPLGVRATAAAGAARDGGYRDDGHPVLLVGLTEDALDGDRVSGLRKDILDVHGLPLHSKFRSETPSSRA